MRPKNQVVMSYPGENCKSESWEQFKSLLPLTFYSYAVRNEQKKGHCEENIA